MRKNIYRGRLLALFSFLLVNYVTIAQNSTVKGKVSNGMEALPGATVSLGNKTILANEKGEFTFLTKAGTFTLIASYSGYKKIELHLVLIEDSIHVYDIILQPSNPLENIIVVGSRSQVQRSNLSTPVPIDLVQLSKLPERQVEMTRIISNYIPSFNAAPHGFLAGRHMLPASLRGLGPDQTLVLLNGKRQHTMASPWIGGASGFGTVGTDLNAIPSDAVEKVEVLRDGASAQYGSDAIAGVIHLRLKESTGITSIRLNAGQYYKGDGEALSFGFNRGFVFLKKGFLNVTTQFRFNNYTQRNGAYNGPVYYNIPNNLPAAQKDSIRLLDNKKVLERGFDRMNHRPLGDNRVYNAALAINGGYSPGNSTTFYWTGIFNYRHVSDLSSNLYRYPRDTTQINLQLYPDGFLPHLISKLPDLSVIGGAKGTTKSGWQWDAGTIFGINSSEVEVTNSNNASQFLLGVAAPTSFYTGKQIFSQLTSNINFRRELSKRSKEISSLHFATGAEWRMEQYRIKEGEEASWKNYSPGKNKVSGSQGLAGFQAENVINKNRHVVASFAEIEMERNKRLLINLAGRLEYYTDYGSNLAGKIAVMYKVLKRLSWRGSLSNGFRAPALQQRYYSLISTMSRQSTVLTRTGTFRNESGIAKAFGISKLRPEKAINISTGFTSAVSKNISITVDAYWIQVKDRIIYSGIISDTFPEVKKILDSFHFNDVRSVRFFSNAINTRTMGLDVVVNGRWVIGRSLLETSLALNLNQTELYGFVQYAKNLPDDSTYRNLLVNREEKCRVEESYPASKIILNIDYKIGKWAIHPAFIRFGKITQRQNDALNNPDQTFTPKIVSSLNVRYDVNHWFALTAGGENIFNTYPDKVKDQRNTANGLLVYSPNFAPFGYNGGYYFVAMNINLSGYKRVER